MFSGNKYNSIITKYARHKHVQKNEIVFKILICANFILNVFSQSILVKINFVTFPFCSNNWNKIGNNVHTPSKEESMSTQLLCTHAFFL